jgi:hypothetical protein
MDNSFHINMVLTFAFGIQSFSLEESGKYHQKFRRFVSGSYWKIQVSPPVITPPPPKGLGKYMFFSCSDKQNTLTNKTLTAITKTVSQRLLTQNC